jgi:uncharacterized protein YjbJ (UPF0337 family)
MVQLRVPPTGGTMYHIVEDANMNEHTIEGNWMQLKGKLRETWGELTDDDVDVIAGQRDQLVGRIKERYGKSTDVVEREVKEFEARHRRAD